MKAQHRLFQNLERGDGDTYEFITGIIPLTMLLVLIAAVAIVRPAQLPVWIAARDCARVLTTTLEEDIAESQAYRTARASLSNMPLARVTNVNINPVYNVTGGDPRNGFSECTVSYTIPLADIPMVGGLFGDVPMDATVRMKIDPLKSDWK
jgi:hypothetical protein